MMQAIDGITVATRISKQRILEGISPYRSTNSFRGLKSLRAHYPKDQGKRIFKPNSVFLILFQSSRFSIQFLLTTKPSTVATFVFLPARRLNGTIRQRN